jgi:hypothetical protein
LEQALESNPDASQLLEQSNDLISSLRVRQSIRTLAHARKNLVGKSKKFGKERVNCITLWFPPTHQDAFQGAYKEPVAVLANNDKSVAIVSLQTQELLIEIEYPDCVNRAVCSPDGRLLIAISDDPYLYIYEQVCLNRHLKDSHGAAYEPVYRWTQRNKIHLVSQRKEDRSDNRGSFAACFSSTGRYLAIGTQYGAISIFDTTTITDPGVISLITSFTSSRPNNTLGAIRAMEFAPGPVDLLAWTEDRGRVGIADMRNGCISRQMIYLDKDDDYHHISPTDRAFIDPRLLESRRTERSTTARIDPTSNADLAEISRQQAAGGDTDLERLNQPLTPEETRVLEALQEHSRRRDERRSQRLLASASPHRPTTTADLARAEGNAAVSQAVNDVLGTIRDIRAQRERLAELRAASQDPSSSSPSGLQTDRDANDALRRLLGPHMRHPPSTGSSTSPRGPLRNRAAAPTSTTAAATTATVTPAGTDEALSARRALQARLLGGDGGPPSSSAWSELEALWNLSFDAPGAPPPPRLDPAPHAALNLRAAAEADSRRRERAAFLMREWEVGPARRAGMGLGLRHSVADPYDTAGLAWSDDGTTL